MTASEAAALVGVSVATIRGWADAGLIPAHRTIGGHRRFEVTELTAWLTARGAPAAERLRPPRTAAAPLVPCPRLARALNGRTDAILDAVERGYDPDVPLSVNRATQAALRRGTLRFLRIATGALDTGGLTTAIGRTHLAGVRAGLQGAGGLGAVAEFGRVAVALALEAEALAASDDMEPAAFPTLLAVRDAMHVSLVGGLMGSHADPDGDGSGAPAPDARGAAAPSLSETG